MDIGNAERRLTDDDFRSSNRCVGKRDLPWAFASTAIFYELIDNDIANKSNNECEDKMLGRVIALGWHVVFQMGVIQKQKRLAVTAGAVPSEGWWSRGESNP